MYANNQQFDVLYRTKCVIKSIRTVIKCPFLLHIFNTNNMLFVMFLNAFLMFNVGFGFLIHFQTDPYQL